MIVKYYYPNPNIDLKDIYHSGTQFYKYTGPLAQYKNVSSMHPTSLLDNWPLPSPACTYFGDKYCTNSSVYTGSSPAGITNYLSSSWGFQTGTLNTADSVYAELRAGRPVIARVYGLGNANYGHFLVVRGYEDNDTPNVFTDDIIYVNDPYDTGWSRTVSGRNRAITYSDFFVRTSNGSPWFREAISISTQSPFAERQNTALVDISNSTHGGGNNSFHTFSVSDPSQWTYYYDGIGHDWTYPKISGQAARWTPKLPSAGVYDVYAQYMADPQSGDVAYSVYSPDGGLLKQTTVSQYSSSQNWKKTLIAQSVSLVDGSYVRASSIPVNSNIDQVLFVYKGQANSTAGLSQELSSLISSSHNATWAYFQEPPTSSAQRWLISDGTGVTYILSGIDGYSGEMVWGQLGGGSSVATTNFSQNTVSVSANTTGLTTNQGDRI
jgi:hypothetical protein